MANHYRRANELLPAVEYYKKAGEVYALSYNNSEALAAFNQALSIEVRPFLDPSVTGADAVSADGASRHAAQAVPRLLPPHDRRHQLGGWRGPSSLSCFRSPCDRNCLVQGSANQFGSDTPWLKKWNELLAIAGYPALTFSEIKVCRSVLPSSGL